MKTLFSTMILTLGLLINCGGGGGGSTSNNSDPPAPTPVPPTPTTPTTPTTSTKFDKPFQMDGIVLRQQGSYHLPDTGMENVADPQTKFNRVWLVGVRHKKSRQRAGRWRRVGSGVGLFGRKVGGVGKKAREVKRVSEGFA